MSNTTSEKGQKNLINVIGEDVYSFTSDSFVTAEEVKSGFYYSFVDVNGLWRFRRSYIPESDEIFKETLKYSPEEEDYFPIEQYHTTFGKIQKDVELFLSSKDFYTSNQIQYRRSYLVFGDAGIGKTRYFGNLVRKLIRDRNAICMQFNSPRVFLEFYEYGYNDFNRVLRDRLKIFVIDEFSEFADVHGNDNKNQTNHAILNVLDNMTLNENTLFFFCTNHPESIPDNIIDRPSRIDVLMEAGFDGFDMQQYIMNWYEFVMKKPFPEDSNGKLFLKKATTMSPAYLKEIFIYAHQHQLSLLEVYEMQMERKKMIADRFQRAQENKSKGKKRAGFSLDEPVDDQLTEEDVPSTYRETGNAD